MCKVSCAYTVPKTTWSKILIVTVNCLGVFVVYKLVNLIYRHTETVVMLYVHAVLYTHRNCYSKGIK